MTIFLDFDRTLFDTERFYSELERSFLLLPALLARESSLQEFLYPDTLPFLVAHKAHDLVLVTRGIPALQRLKAEKSGVLAHIPRALFVAEGTKAKAIQEHVASHPLQEPAYFLDDLPEELAAVRQELPNVSVVRMRRLQARTSSLPGLDLPEAADLSDFAERYATAGAVPGLA